MDRRRGGTGRAPVKVLVDRVAPPSLQATIDATAPEWADVVSVSRDDPRFAAALAEAEVVLHVLDPISGGDIDAAPALRLIQKFGTGVNTIDLDAAERAGVAVTNMPGANAPAVAELTVALMLAGLRDLPSLVSGTRAGTAWPGLADDPAPGAELGGRQVGLIGYGAIARRVEVAVQALGAATVHFTPTEGRPGWTPLDELLATSDVVSMHVPLVPDTERLLDASRLAMLKAGALVVNTARGGLIDHAALVEQLDRGHLRGACLDVLPTEPLPAEHPLLRASRVVATPHIGWLTDETLARCWQRALDNCRRLRDGQALVDRVR